MYGYLLCFIFSVSYYVTYAQFSDSITHYVFLSSSGNVNITRDGHTYLVNNEGRLTIKKKQVSLNATADWLYGKHDSILTNNDFAAALNVNLYSQPNSNFYYWGLANYATSYSLKVASQLQSGLGIAYNIINRANLWLNLSDGIVYETTSLKAVTDMPTSYSTFRNSLRLSFRIEFKKLIILDGIHFLQNSLQYKSDYIIRSNTNLTVKVNQWLRLGTSLTYNRFTHTNTENILLTYGLVAEKYFKAKK